MPPETPHSQMEPTNLTAESRPTVRSDLAANSWSIKRAIKTGSLYLGFAALLVTMLGVALTYSDHLRNKEADRREDLKSFQELLAQAEQLYCEQAADGYTYDIRRVLLRAQQLVPRVQS